MSGAAPIVSDKDSGFIEAETPKEALEKVVERYSHPCGLFSAIIQSCEEKPKILARFLSKKCFEKYYKDDNLRGTLKKGDFWQFGGDLIE
jgi:hypothetical protein